MRSSRMCLLQMPKQASAPRLVAGMRCVVKPLFVVLAAWMALALGTAVAAADELITRADEPTKRTDASSKPADESSPQTDDGPKGSLVIVGGALRYDQKAIWSDIVERAGGPGAKIAVMPTASGNPIRSGNRVINALRSAGAYPFLVPVGVQRIDVDYRQAVRDPQWIEQVKGAGGVFFTGGEQSRIVEALYTEDGKNTPLLDAIWEVYQKGGVIAGTSAGAAIMSRVMFRDARNVLATLEGGVTMGKEISHGLGFLNPAWFVEQHSLARGRFARALAAMQSQGLKFGIGVEENTALVVTNGHEVRVVGHKGAVVLDLSQATSDPALKGFNLKNARLTYLDRGDRLDLDTLTVTPAPEKENDYKIDPNAEDFRPEHDDRLVTNDILGNNTVADVLTKLMVNKTGDAIGLAFDGAKAMSEPTRGFEFHFYRAKDTVGWRTEAFGGEDFTIANVHLDIRPVEIIGPLYK